LEQKQTISKTEVQLCEEAMIQQAILDSLYSEIERLTEAAPSAKALKAFEISYAKQSTKAESDKAKLLAAYIKSLSDTTSNSNQSNTSSESSKSANSSKSSSRSSQSIKATFKPVDTNSKVAARKKRMDERTSKIKLLNSTKYANNKAVKSSPLLNRITAQRDYDKKNRQSSIKESFDEWYDQQLDKLYQEVTGKK
jgi:hypothetical protein